MRSKAMRRWVVGATTALLVLAALPGPALASHPTPPGNGPIEFPYPLECNGDVTDATVTPPELTNPNALGPGWLSEFGMVVARSLTISDANGNVVFVTTNGKKLAKGLETIICTGPAFLPGGVVGTAVFEFVLLP